jgi:hypothetical protein
MGAGVGIRLFKLAFRTNHFRLAAKIKFVISSNTPLISCVKKRTGVL